ncbi:MAG: 16S rRNA (cytosine(1402)-N(4))-methyltransferase RsmH [Bacteroidales bacterium]|jgi:16S rRNA (cytosine1402-N4)-methyltransferase|nr:16S rRNA (cytosine(1402)-N(4))-methyltransferase RsmH [Bacteroidales bacterium]
MSEYHTPVLLNESVEALAITPDGIYADATFGGGGHSLKILSMLGRKGRLIAFDKDFDALANAPADDRLILIHNNFKYIHHLLRAEGYGEGIDGIIADLGVSSHQFDTGERGFSFRFDSKLDMRMNSLQKLTAQSVLNYYRESELGRIFNTYGEVPDGYRLAGMICTARKVSPIVTTGDLYSAISKALPKFCEHKTLAKIYQALRIEVNGEMDDLTEFLKEAAGSLKTGGRIAVITYQSLEDRIVKNAFRNIPFQPLIKKPVKPEESEIEGNTRARSAKLRVAEKTGEEKI